VADLSVMSVIPPEVEPHSTPKELAKLWGVSVQTITRLFENEPGVLVLGSAKESRFKRKYRTMRIPLSVIARVHERFTQHKKAA
jgi:hypothetical protein